MKTKKITKLIITFVIALAIIIFVSVKLSKEGFQTIDPTNYPGGNLLGFRVKNSLQEITSFLQIDPNRSKINIQDCNGNTVWSAGSPLSPSTSTGLYMLTSTGIIPLGTNLVNVYQQTVTGAAAVGINVASIVFSNYEYPSAMCGNISGVAAGSVNPELSSVTVGALQGVSSKVGNVTGQVTQTSSSVSGQLINTLNTIFTPQVSAKIVSYLQYFFKTGDTLLQS